jgi:hypothetical protein
MRGLMVPPRLERPRLEFDPAVGLGKRGEPLVTICTQGFIEAENGCNSP